jgi:hypothetical protein
MRAEDSTAPESLARANSTTKSHSSQSIGLSIHVVLGGAMEFVVHLDE